MIALPQRHVLAVLTWCALAATLARADEVGCAAAPALLRIAAAPKPLNRNLDWSSGHFSATTGGDTVLSDDVEIKFEDRLIRGDKITYDPVSNSLHVEGHFSYLDPTIRVESNSGSYDNGGASFSGAHFQLLKQPGRGDAESITQLPSGEIELSRVAYTTCPADTAGWQLRARRITLNLDNERGVGRDTRIELNGVPVLYLPWISFPLSSQRQSGLLFPMLGTSSRNGATISVPYYWNIAPNQDLTLTPTLYTSRGLNLGTQYRLLEPRGSGVLQVDFLSHDQVTGDYRSYQSLMSEWQLPASWRARIAAENVSDTHYFEDFAQGPQASSTAFLARRVDLGFRGDVWRLNAGLLQFQTLDTTLASSDRPYAELPRLTAHARLDADSGLRTTLDGEVVGFSRASSIDGWRANVTPAVSWQHVRPGYYLRPGLAWDLTGYRLSNAGAGGSSSPTRSVPIATFDTGLQLERSIGRDGNRQLTLEPRLLYVYIPYRDQSQLPVFDSGSPDPNFISLFRANRYVGTDRIGDANKLTLGVTSRMYDGATGKHYLSATFGQSFNFDTPRVTLPNETPDTRNRSDLIANVELHAYHNLSLRMDLAWNPVLSSSEKTLIALQYRPAGNKVINVGYRYDRGSANQATVPAGNPVLNVNDRFGRGSVDQIDVSVAWPIGRHWELYGRNVYSLRDRATLDNFAGLRFRGDCWGLRAVVRRSLSSRPDVGDAAGIARRDTGIYLQFELTGLSSVGTGADTFLQQSIQGYSAADPRP